MDSGGEDLPVEGIEIGNRWKGFQVEGIEIDNRWKGFPVEEIGNVWRRSFGGRNSD